MYITRGDLLRPHFRLLLPGGTILILSLTDHTDCTDYFACATCFSTTEMTDFEGVSKLNLCGLKAQ